MEGAEAAEGMQGVAAQVDMEGHAHIIKGAQTGEETDVLKGSRNASFGDLIRPQTDEGNTLEPDVAFRGLIDAGDQIKHGGFAGAVWPDQTDQFVGPHLQGQLGDSRQAAEPDRASVQVQERRMPSGRGSVHYAVVAFFLPIGQTNSPCGRVSISTMSRAE